MRLFSNLADIWRNMEGSGRLRAGYIVIALLALSLAWSALAAQTTALERKRAARELVLKELMPLKVSYQSAKQSAGLLTGRMSGVRPDDTPAKIVEEIGIKGKGVKIVPVKGEEKNGIIEDAADVRIEGVTANEAVNLIYRLEKGTRPVSLKKTNMRVRFDDPSRFDLTLVVALLKPSAGYSK
jgi:general secretion pathway protein M